MTKNYTKLNRDVSIAIDLKSELETIKSRLLPLKYCPDWIKGRIEKTLVQVNYLIDVLADYRDKEEKERKRK